MLPSTLDAQFGTPYLRSASFDTDSEHANAKAEASLATSREASARALEEAMEADGRRAVAEEHRRELQALNASLEQQVEAR